MIWKTLKGFSKYEISSNGDVKNIKNNKIINGSIQEYINVSLYPDDNDSKKKSLRLHRLVAELFCENPNNYKIVNHINSNKLDNRAINLEWTTTKLNAEHASKNGLLNPINKRAVRRICPKTNETKEYNSISEAFNDNKDKIKYDSYIVSVCSGVQKTSGGFLWEYVTKEEKQIKPKGKKIKGYENYLITKEGNVYNLKSKKILKPSKNKAGYLIIDLYASEYDESKNSSEYSRKRHAKRKKFRIHRLVAEHFIKNQFPKLLTEVNHKNKIRDDNNIDNLEWVTQLGNAQHAHNKPVIQCSSNGYFIKIFESLLHANNETGIEWKNISASLTRNIKAGGFIWKYANKYEYTKFKEPDNTILFIHPKYATLVVK